uniref:Erb-b2 receptor tyrosine kinase 3b n=1 Tax=Sphaeramia orbicularis TaxID=375764 RepID=A0A673BQV2_9TELE
HFGESYLLCVFAVVCPGTQNGLSSTGSQENQYNLIKDRYDGCEIVMGNLEITQIESNWDLSFLKTIREVTGYILVAMNHFQEIPLGQLRVIRGNNLYERRFALSVFFNYPKDGSNGLRQLGLMNLTEILEGGVQIINNKYLSYGPWIYWQDIIRDNSAPIDIQYNGERGWCPCHRSCGDYCWGPNNDQCQILTKTVCAPQCNGRCFGTSPRDCCHIECAAGCKGPLDMDCFVSALCLSSADNTKRKLSLMSSAFIYRNASNVLIMTLQSCRYTFILSLMKVCFFLSAVFLSDGCEHF